MVWNKRNQILFLSVWNNHMEELRISKHAEEKLLVFQEMCDELRSMDIWLKPQHVCKKIKFIKRKYLRMKKAVDNGESRPEDWFLYDKIDKLLVADDLSDEYFTDSEDFADFMELRDTDESGEISDSDEIKAKKPRRPPLNNRSLELFLEVWKEFSEEMVTCNQMLAIYGRMCSKLKRRNLHYKPPEIKNQISNLISKYRRINKMRAKGDFSMPWVYYEEVGKLVKIWEKRQDQKLSNSLYGPQVEILSPCQKPKTENGDSESRQIFLNIDKGSESTPGISKETKRKRTTDSCVDGMDMQQTVFVFDENDCIIHETHNNVEGIADEELLVEGSNDTELGAVSKGKTSPEGSTVAYYHTTDSSVDSSTSNKDSKSKSTPSLTLGPEPRKETKIEMETPTAPTSESSNEMGNSLAQCLHLLQQTQSQIASAVFKQTDTTKKLVEKMDKFVEVLDDMRYDNKRLIDAIIRRLEM